MPNEQKYPADPNALLSQANQLHDAGKLREAARIYAHLLKNNPPTVFILNRLATISLALGHVQRAIGFLKKCLELAPDHPQILTRLASALSAAKQFEDALSACDRAIALRPQLARAHHMRAHVLAALDRPHEALASLDDVLALLPGLAQAHCDRGDLLTRLNRMDEAGAAYARALELNPGLAKAQYSMTHVLRWQKRLEEALASCDRAIALAPGSSITYSARGGVLADLSRFDDALASHDLAVVHGPAQASAHYHRALLLRDLKRFDEAMASYEAAIAAQPDYAHAWGGKAELLLLTGDFKQGWELYEWRWKTNVRKKDPVFADCPVWSGEQTVAGKTTVIRPEVGLGDYIMFARYAVPLQQMGANVVIYAPQPLAALFSTLGAGISVVPEGQPLGQFDLQCPIMSLPLAFNTTLQTIPADVPYLGVPPDRRTLWKQKLGPRADVPRVGLMWAGKGDRNIDRGALKRRSLSLETLEPLLNLPLEFHALQKECLKSEAPLLAGHARIKTWHDELNDLADTAALIDEMDLVISIDTSVAHLAGALGKPLWVMLPYASDYRWMMSGPTTPWYPTATLFRQTEIGNWAEVVRRITDQLKQYRPALQLAATRAR